METKFVLTQLVPRAKTTDTSIIAVSDTKDILEEYLADIIKSARDIHNEEDYLDYFCGTFSIHEVQYI